MAQSDRPNQFDYAYIAGISKRCDEAIEAAAGHAGQGSLGDIALARGLIMSKIIQRGGTLWNASNAFSVRFDSRALMDQITIQNTGYAAEKLSMSMEEAEALADFILDAKKAFGRYKFYQEHPVTPFADDIEDVSCETSYDQTEHMGSVHK